MAPRFTLGSDQRLKCAQHIETLFRTGKAFSVFPLRVVWLLVPRPSGEGAVRVGFSAPKKKFRLATQRNRIKRLLRESWRLQQGELAGIIPESQQLQLFLLFTDLTLPEYKNIFLVTGSVITKLRQTVAPHDS